jgi:hypothetical protein
MNELWFSPALTCRHDLLHLHLRLVPFILEIFQLFIFFGKNSILTSTPEVDSSCIFCRPSLPVELSNFCEVENKACFKSKRLHTGANPI